MTPARSAPASVSRITDDRGRPALGLDSMTPGTFKLVEPLDQH